MKASRIISPDALRRTSFGIAIVMGLSILTGCVVQKPIHLLPKSISRVTYDPKSCTEMPDGNFRCKDVVFHITAVQVPKP